MLKGQEQSHDQPVKGRIVRNHTFEQNEEHNCVSDKHPSEKNVIVARIVKEQLNSVDHHSDELNHLHDS